MLVSTGFTMAAEAASDVAIVGNHTTVASVMATMSSTSVSTYIGVALAIGGNILISIALNVQKFAHMSNRAKAEASGEQVNYLKQPTWWLGMCLMISGTPETQASHNGSARRDW